MLYKALHLKSYNIHVLLKKFNSKLFKKISSDMFTSAVPCLFAPTQTVVP